MQLLSLVIIISCMIICFAAVIYGVSTIAKTLTGGSSTKDDNCIGPVTVVSADGSTSVDTSDCYSLTVSNASPDEVCIVLDGQFFILEEGASFTGTYCRGHHRMQVGRRFTKKMMKSGFTLGQDDTVTISFENDQYRLS